METSEARAGSAQRRQPKALNPSRKDASKVFNSLMTAPGEATNSVPLVNRLHLNWQSVPAAKQAKLYSPSTTALPRNRNNRLPGLSTTTASSTKQTLSPIQSSKNATLPTRKLPQQASSASLAAFEQKYAAEDPLMRYILHVIRTGSPVRRSEIPRAKRILRKVRPEEDVLYLVHCKQPPCGFRNVYWLTFADEGTILRNDNEVFEYFTLGSHGLTRFKGGQGVEFSNLEGWIDEKRAFDHMTSMKGLERIQQMIFFFSWKRRTVQRRLYRVRERLACSLFTCHPVAGRLLMDVRDVCAEIESEAKCEYVDTDTTYTLDILARIHQERVRVVKASITKKIQLLCMAIDDVTRGIPRYREGQDCNYITTDHEAFSKTLKLSSLRERMFTFLRLVDCHVSEAIYQHVTLVVQDLRVRICGDYIMIMDNTDSAQSVGVEERRGNLCRSELTEAITGVTPLAQSREHVTFAVQTQGSDALVVAIPGLYVSLEDDVNFDRDVNSSTMHITPAKFEVLELVHTILMQYCIALDELPRVLTDQHFQYVLTPFVPSLRRDFGESLMKPSHLVLESYEPDLLDMRRALDMHFRRIGIIQQEHLRCIRAVRVAERESPVETTRRNSITALCESDEEYGRLPELPDLSSSAVAYELAQKTWNRFAQYANNAAPMLHVGYLLLDQRSFVDRLRRHVSMRVAEMDDSLPLIYQQFLTSLLKDVDGRIEKVTKIPTNLAEANMWLTQVTSMMSTHPFRQCLDTKIDNLARLRELIKERGLISLKSEIQDSIRKLELTWASVIETLLTCLARVEERGSEHRRSVQDVITKVEEYITDQMQLIIKTFEELPSGCEENEDEGNGIISNKLSQTEKSEEDMVQQLEDLVVMDVERKNVVLQFEEYDREHRAIMNMPLQHAVWMSSHSNSDNLSAVSLADKLASELLLLYIVTALELRKWFKSWKKLQEKWLGTPLTGLHPGTMINRIKQFRRRLVDASSRLSRLSSVLLQILPGEQSSQCTQQIENEDHVNSVYFVRKDFELIRVFDSSIEEMLNCNRIFQAITGGAFSEARWAAMNQLLNVHVGPNGTGGGSHLTLRLMKNKCGPGEMETFLEVCDECIVEAKLHVKLEQARQRLGRIELRVEEVNYSVRCEGVPQALAQLDEIAVDLKLCLFGQNTELQLCLELRAELEHKVQVCEHILSYQKHWRLRCEASKLHEVDEFFSKRFSGSGSDFALPRSRNSQHKAGLKQEQIVWQAFLDASHAWSDRLRRLFFVSPQQPKVEQMRTNPRSLLGRKSAVAAASATPAPMALLRRLTKSMDCTLDNVMESFEGFDFESNFAACERGIELVQNYLEFLREKTPRMYCLDETSMFRLLMRDMDMKQLHQSLAICFPRVHRFTISRATNRVGSTIEVFGKPETVSHDKPERTSKTNGTIVIVGIEGMHNNARTLKKSGHFRLPVAKIGRLKFWFTRLEEEMSSMVLTDLKRALEWSTHDFDSSEFAACDTLLPQSIVTACGLQFTFEMNRALRSNPHEAICHQLHQLHVNVHNRLDGLVATRRADKTASNSVRLENMILLSAMQSETVNHVTELIVQGRQEDALFFWSMQFQTRVFAEIISTPGSTVQPSPGKHFKVEKIELLPTSSNFLKATTSNHSGQSTSMSVCCQVAHLQIPLGQEFVGWGRVAIVSPFTQRCSYALFSALRMHHTALVVPYHEYRTGTDPTSWLWGISQMLLRPCIEFSCNLYAGATTTHHLGDLMSATSRLNGFLIVRNLLQLSAAFVGVVQERMLQHFHQATPVGNHSMHYQQHQTVTNSIVLSRHPGGIFYGASAIFIPLVSTDDLQRSKLVRSIRTQFRAVALSRPDIKYVVESMLIADSYEAEQIRELNVVQAFKAIDTGKAGPVCALNVELLISSVFQGAHRLREHYRVVWDFSPLTRADSALFQKHKSSTVSSDLTIREGQCIFRQAFHSAIKTMMSEQHVDHGDNVAMEQVNTLLTCVFPLSIGGRLVTKDKGEEEAVAAAVSIYLESAYALPTDCEQFEVIMELWRALQTFPAALVYGSPGSGKTTCITALHRALMALELSEQSQENEAVGRNTSKVNPPSSLAQLVIINPQLLSLDQFYSRVAVACANGDSGDKIWKPNANSLKWVLVDGDIDSGILDRLLECDNRACSSASSLPSSSILYRSESSSVLSGDYSDPSDNPRLLFEVTTLANLSPSALRRCWALNIPKHYITVASIIRAWRSRWESQLVFPPGSRGFGAISVVFRTVDVLISTICLGFVVEETNQDLVADDGDVRDVINTGDLRLGCLSLNHITQTALTLVSSCCFLNKSLLQELSYLRLVELVAFAVLWGFGGHLPDSCKVKLENYVRVKSKEHSETKHLAELARGLMDGNHFEDVWDELQPRFATVQTTAATSNGAKPEAKMQSAIDTISGQVLVLVPAATSLIRICTMLLHSSHSFLFIGPAASGKTSLLRWLIHRNREAEAAEMKIEVSLHERHVHGILDWTNVPAAWFNPIDQHDAGSRAKMREEAELFAGRSRHSFVFLDDLDASGTIADKIQIQFVRTMLDHRTGYSTKHRGFQRVEKQIGAGMRFDESEPSISPTLARFMRHFIVFRVPSYTQKELLSVFRVRFQQYFETDLLQASTERRLSTKGDISGGGQQLPLEEVILRGSVDFAVEMTALQQLGHTEHPCLYLFNLHHVNALLERTFIFAADMSGSMNAASEGTTLVQLGKVHQSWLSELQNIFLSNCPMESLGVSSQVVKLGAGGGANGDDIQQKISTLLRHLSEKYFSVAFRGRSDHSILTSVESLHFLVELAEHHVQAPLLQPRLIQLRELLNEHMTAANGVCRRSSDQTRGTYGGGNSTIPATELVSRVLLEIATASTSSDVATGLDTNLNRPYSSGQLTAYETKVLLSSSWYLTQAMHLVHALSQQQQVVVSSSSRHTRLLSDRLLRFACDLQGYKVHTIQDDNGENVGDQHKRVLRAILGAAGVRQERVALWIREQQISSDHNSSHMRFLLDIIKELCLEKLPSLVLLPGGHELRDELVLSSIQGRKQLEIVTEAELMVEFQQRIQKNFRLCILEDDHLGSEKDRASASAFVRWMKTRPSCHWRRLDFTEFELQRLVPEVARATLTSPSLCGVNWDSQQVERYVILCQNVYSLMMRSTSTPADPTSQQDYLLSFMTNVTVTYRAKLQYHQKKVVRLKIMLKTLAFVRDEVVPVLERLQQRFELQSSQIDSELKSIDLEQVPTKQDENSVPVHETPSVDLEMKEARWALQARREELMMMDSETKLRLEQISRFLAEWRHIMERMNYLFTKWTQERDQEKCKTEHEIMGVAVQDSAQRVFAHVTSLGASKRDECWSLLGKLVLKTIVGDSSPGIERRLMDIQLVGDMEDESVGVVRFIWTSCFSFLRDRYIYRTVRLADELCDRVPVIVDPSGVLQRFLVHTFSGHTLFSTLSGCGGAGEAESENSSATKESMVISCDDPKLELHLQEGLRLGVPVLLVNFRSADTVLLDRLQPFLSQTRLSHAPPRRSMLHELTMKYYEDQRRQKQRRTSISNSTTVAISSLMKTAAIVNGGTASKPKRAVRAGKHKAVVIDPVSVAAAVSTSTTLSPTSCAIAKTPGRCDSDAKIPAGNRNMGNGRNFQIYAVTTTPVPLELQHALAAQFVHFTVSVPDFELKALFELPCVEKTHHKLLQELRGDQIGLTDCWMKLIQTRDQLNQLLVALIPPTVDDSPFAARRSNQGVTIQLQERFSELALQFANEYHAEHIWSSRLQSLQAMPSKLESASEVYATMASRLVSVARCMATMSSSLTIGTRKSPFYLQSVRYLENAAAQQLAVQGDDDVQLSNRALTALITRISSGFVSDSHRQIFSFLESIQVQVQTTRPSINDEMHFSARHEAVVWLVTSRIRKERLKDASSLELYPSDERRHTLGIFPGRWNSQRWSGDSGISLVDRLRRRIKLCAYLFNGWKASGSSKNARGKQQKAPRPLFDGSTGYSIQKPGRLGKAENSSYENKELVMEQLQQKLDKLLADSETLWYEWKTTRIRLQLDMEQLFSDMGKEGPSIQSSTEMNNAILPTAIALISLEELSTRYKMDSMSDDEMTSWSHSLVRLMLAKTFFPSSFAQVLDHYLQLYGIHASELKLCKLDSTREDDETISDELWTSWSSPASLVADVAPLRGKQSRAHLPRALIIYMPDERSRVELNLSVWDIAVFVDTSIDNITFREELIMLITTKHRFVLELVDAKHAESALTLVSQLVNEHALLSVPEWYVLASFAVATTIENGKLTVMDRIVVGPSSSLSQLNFVDRDRVHARTTEQMIQNKLVEECGASSSVASNLTLAVLKNHGHSQDEQVVNSSVVRDLEDVLHFSSVEEVAVNVAEREKMTNTLLRLLAKPDTNDSSQNDAARAAMLSSELLDDLFTVGDSSLVMLTDEPVDEWLLRYSPTDGEASCEQLWTCFCQVEDIFKSLQAASESNPAENDMTEYFPWQSFDFELTNQLSAFKAIHKHLRDLQVSPKSASSHESNCQQLLSSLARGYVPFKWAENYFAGTAWPAGASGTVSVAQMLLLIACRVGVLVRCLGGHRAWALNLTVVSDACRFLRCLCSYTAERTGIPESSLVLILELDSPTDSIDATVEEDATKKKTLAIAKNFAALCTGGSYESDWHGAVLHHIDGGVESWGIRVEGVVLVQQASITKLHPLPMCRITCQPCVETTSRIEAPVILLPSMSPYQQPPTFSQDLDNNRVVRVVLGRSINSVIDIRDDLPTEMMKYAVGVTVFPDDDSHEIC